MAKAKLKSYLKKLHGRSGNYIHYNVKGRQYVRSYAVPANPRTDAQQKNRCTFALAVRSWQELSPGHKLIYNRKAIKKSFSGYNLFISMMMKGQSLPTNDTEGKDRINNRYFNTTFITGINSVSIPSLPGINSECLHNPGVIPWIHDFPCCNAA